MYGFQPNSPGAFAEFVVRKEANLHKIPDSMDYETASLVEPISVAFHAVWQIARGIKPTDTVLIFGAGPIGLFALIIAKSSSAKVVNIDPIKKRRDLAHELGADEVLDPSSGNQVQEILKLTGGVGGNIAFETSGSDIAREVLPDVVDCGGQIILIGISKPKKIPFELEKLISKGLVMKGAEGSPLMFPQTIKFLDEHEDSFTKVISHRLPLSRAMDAFRLADDRDNAEKILLNA